MIIYLLAIIVIILWTRPIVRCVAELYKSNIFKTLCVNMKTFGCTVFLIVAYPLSWCIWQDEAINWDNIKDHNGEENFFSAGIVCGGLIDILIFIMLPVYLLTEMIR